MDSTTQNSTDVTEIGRPQGQLLDTSEEQVTAIPGAGRDLTLAIIIIVSIVAAGGRGIGNVTTYVPLYLQNILHIESKSSAGFILFTILLIGSVLGPLIGGRLSKTTPIVSFSSCTHASEKGCDASLKEKHV